MIKSSAMWCVVILVLLSGGPATAQETYYNQVGLYLSSDGPDGSGRSGTSVIGAPVVAYLVLSNPVDIENGNALFPYITGFELTLNFDPVPNNNLLLLNTVFPPGYVDILPIRDINQGFLEYPVRLPDPTSIPAFDGTALLLTFTFMNVSTATTFVTLSPVSNPTIPGQMVYFSDTGEPQVMHSAGGTPFGRVFAFNGDAVPTENQAFGSLKALYR